MTTRRDLEMTLENRRNDLRIREGAYAKAKAAVESPDGKAKQDALLDELLLTVEQFNPGDSGDKAIALIAVAKRIVAQMRGPLRVIADYETRKATIDSLSEKLEEVSAAS